MIGCRHINWFSFLLPYLSLVLISCGFIDVTSKMGTWYSWVAKIIPVRRIDSCSLWFEPSYGVFNYLIPIIDSSMLLLLFSVNVILPKYASFYMFFFFDLNSTSIWISFTTTYLPTFELLLIGYFIPYPNVVVYTTSFYFRVLFKFSFSI